MKLDVPFVGSESHWRGKGWCGPLALASLLRYYGFEDSVEEIVEAGKTSDNGGTVPQGLINFCLNKGMRVIYFAKEEVESENSEKYSEKFRGFLRKINSEELEKIFVDENRKFEEYKFSDKEIDIEDVEKFLDEGKPVLMIHNVAVVFGEDKMWPHYVVVVGYDEDSFYIHNVAKGNSAFQKIDKKLLEESWDYEGFGRHLIVPYLEKKDGLR